MRKYAGFHEIRFKIPDYHFQMLQDMAMYLYEAKVIDKPNLQSFGRFCIMQVTNARLGLMCQWKSARDRHLLQQQQMWQKQLNNNAPPPSLGYNLQQQQQNQQNQQQKLPTIDDIY
jgi:hypothetical protein